jgi:serine/threonine protein kinase
MMDVRFGEKQEEEMELIRSLRHPNIIQVFQKMQTVHNLFISMEYAPHGDLTGHVLNQNG